MTAPTGRGVRRSALSIVDPMTGWTTIVHATLGPPRHEFNHQPKRRYCQRLRTDNRRKIRGLHEEDILAFEFGHLARRFNERRQSSPEIVAKTY